MKRCVIIGGAPIQNYARVRTYLHEDDFAVYCDAGLNHREGLGLAPGLVVGDFDSHENPQLPVETIVLPHEKDDTDTVYAVKEALRRGYEEFLLLGVIGGRLDHTLGNVAILQQLDVAGKKALAIDDYSELQIVSKEPAYVPDSFAYFSLLNISGLAQEITVCGAKYPLTGAELTCEYPLGVSNEVLPGETAEIRVGRGRLLLIKVYE